MTEAYRTAELENAAAKRDEARAKFNAAKRGSRKWLYASEETDFWIGKVAFLDVPIIRVEEEK